MPVYEYECQSCGERFELRRNIADRDTDMRCPECNDEHPRRLCSMFGRVMTTRPGFFNAGPT